MSRSAAGLSDIRPPTAELSNVGGPRRGISLTNESRHHAAIPQFDLADPQWRGYSRHERPEVLGGDAPHFDLDGRPAAGNAEQSGAMRRSAGQSDQPVGGRGM